MSRHDLAVLGRPAGAALTPRSRRPLPRLGEGEVPLDYCLRPYAAEAPTEGKLASLAILQESFAIAGVEDEGLALVAHLVAGLGARRTVWGLKHRGGGAFSWELYFYAPVEGAPAPPGPALSLEHVRACLAPSLEVDARLDRPVRWLMFSIEFDAAQLRARGPVGACLYVHGDDLSYDLRGTTLTMGNRYHFYEPAAQIRAVLSRIEGCVHFDPSAGHLQRLIPPALFRGAFHVCVANKRTADGMYFSRVPWSGLRWFLRAKGWPASVTGFVEQHASALAHLRWDVGWDFRLEDGALVDDKSGFYGYF